MVVSCGLPRKPEVFLLVRRPAVQRVHRRVPHGQRRVVLPRAGAHRRDGPVGVHPVPRGVPRPGAGRARGQRVHLHEPDVRGLGEPALGGPRGAHQDPLDLFVGVGEESSVNKRRKHFKGGQTRGQPVG